MMTKREEVLQQQKNLNILFTAWMNEKKKHEVLTFQKRDGKIIEHYPDDTIRVIKNAK